MIAAWWRMARQEAAGDNVSILSDDRDLLQLCDEMTAVWPLSSEYRDHPVTAATVELVWGCAPGRLPLLRALVGDPADNIPGVKGIGLATAQRMLAASPDDSALLDALAGSRGPDDGDAGLAQLYRVLMDLRDPMIRPYDDKGEAFWADPVSRQLSVRSFLDGARWRPECHSATLLEFLREHGMQRMTKWIMDGKLPWPAPD
jgi:5'-3' exonuclease